MIRNLTRTLSKFCFEVELKRAKSKLRNAVISEYKYEHSNYEPADKIKQVLQAHKFIINDFPKSSKIWLDQSQSDAQIKIVFSATKPIIKDEQSESDEDDDSAQQSLIRDKIKETVKETDAVEPYEFSVDFSVYIQSKSGEAVCYECNSRDQKININFVTFVYDIEQHMNLSKEDRLIHQYTGPVFNTLDERLQAGLLDYLSSYGINDDLAGAIEQLSLDKEQRLYMDFLLKMEKFLQ